MTNEADQDKENAKKLEYLSDCQVLAESYLDKPELNDVLRVAVDDGILDANLFAHYLELTGDERYALQAEMFRSINTRDETVERAQIQEQMLRSPRFNDETLVAAEALDMRQDKALAPGYYKALLVHGGINQTPFLRTKFALDALDKNETPDYQDSISAEFIVLNGCDRKLSADEKTKVGNYAQNNPQVEYDLMNAAAEFWLSEHDLQDVAVDSYEVGGASQQNVYSGMPYKMRVYDLRQAKDEGRLGKNYPDAIFSVNAPFDPTQFRRQGGDFYKDRAGTDDILDMVARVAEFEPGDLVASISHRPVSNAQYLATLEKLMPLGVNVEEAGYNSEPLFNSIRFSEICKIIHVANLVRTRAKQLSMAA